MHIIIIIFNFISDRNKRKSDGKTQQATAQVTPQISAPHLTSQQTTGSNYTLANSGNLKNAQPASLTNTPIKNFDENSTGGKKPDMTEKRGPGRPKGSTNKGTTEQKLLLSQQQQSNDIIKGINIKFPMYFWVGSKY